MYTFTEVYTIRKNEETIKNIIRLGPGVYPLNEKQKDWFLANSHLFTSLRYLDLTNQDIDDEFIEDICVEDFERLEEINLSSNLKITTAALDAISSSKSLGSKRSQLSISGKYEVAQSIVNVIVSKTKITPEDLEDYNNLGRFNFNIEYDNIPDRRYLGVKILHLTTKCHNSDTYYCPHCPCYQCQS